MTSDSHRGSCQVDSIISGRAQIDSTYSGRLLAPLVNSGFVHGGKMLADDATVGGYNFTPDCMVFAKMSLVGHSKKGVKRAADGMEKQNKDDKVAEITSSVVEDRREPSAKHKMSHGCPLHLPAGWNPRRLR